MAPLLKLLVASAAQVPGCIPAAACPNGVSRGAFEVGLGVDLGVEVTFGIEFDAPGFVCASTAAAINMTANKMNE